MNSVVKKGSLGVKNAQKTVPSRKLSDEDVVKLGNDLIRWLTKKWKDQKDFPVHLTEWYHFEEGLSFPEWDALCQRVHFLPYYKTALQLMALFTMKNKELSSAYGSRFLGLYSSELRNHEKEIAKEKAKAETEAKIEFEASRNQPPNDKLITDLINAIKGKSDNASESKTD